MARLSHISISPTAAGRGADALTDLNRLLSRLHQAVLRADADRERRLRTSEYERRKVNANIDYARSLLTQMEHDALAVKVHSRRQEAQADLNRKRELLEQLADRMRDLEEMGARAAEGDEGDEGDESSDGEDVLAGIVPTPSESTDSGPTGDGPEGGPGGEGGGDEDQPPGRAAEPPAPPLEAHAEEVPGERHPARQPETQTSQTLRSRGRHADAPPPERPEQAPQAGTTALSAGASRALLFGSGAGRPAGADAAASATEAVLDHHKAEQDLLSESILRLAGDLKLSSLAFGEALEEDTEVLARAGEGLDRSERGLEAAARRMGALVRATEGKGWWGRVVLYAWIYGMMVLLVLLVFAMPKLRF